ncbi:MAG: PhnD/SsuA/transferrin family substrate-binding protein [Gammaproteobacteria bacterium]|nr:PhnD/SsuA/transferrin family substrate-binding protein [Gammaproteobacteria bacterium]
MLAALPWYDYPSTRECLDEVWRETRLLLGTTGIEQLPGALNHADAYDEFFADPRLILSQCCSLDLFQAHTRNVVAFAAPVITAIDVSPGNYFSYIVARPSADLLAPRVIINNRFSYSGHAAIRIWLQKQEVSDYTIAESGSHAQSLEALREQRADIAAIDALSWQHLDKKGLKILDASDPAPAPPFIMGRQSTVPAEALTQALDQAFERHGHQLGVTGVVPVSRRYYRKVAEQAATL